jgi:hypothetical protein
MATLACAPTPPSRDVSPKGYPRCSVVPPVGDPRMGMEIDTAECSSSDCARFSQRLAARPSALERVLARPGFVAGSASIGAELELFLVGAGASPLPVSPDAARPRELATAPSCWTPSRSPRGVQPASECDPELVGYPRRSISRHHRHGSWSADDRGRPFTGLIPFDTSVGRDCKSPRWQRSLTGRTSRNGKRG